MTTQCPASLNHAAKPWTRGKGAWCQTLDSRKRGERAAAGELGGWRVGWPGGWWLADNPGAAAPGQVADLGCVGLGSVARCGHSQSSVSQAKLDRGG